MHCAPIILAGMVIIVKTTPTIDILIQQGTNFHNVYTVVPRTFPAWVSIVTSQLPMKHHISHMFPMAVTRKQIL